MVPAMILLVREHTDTDDSHTQTGKGIGHLQEVSSRHHDTAHNTQTSANITPHLHF